MHKGTEETSPSIWGILFPLIIIKRAFFCKPDCCQPVSYDKNSGFPLESAILSGIPVLHLAAAQCRQDTVSSWIGFCGTGNAKVSRLVAFWL